jgi:protein phosphatase 2C
MESDLRVEMASLIGMRSSNEDVCDYLLNMSEDGAAINTSTGSTDIFIICDGHGGEQVSQFVMPILLKFFTKKGVRGAKRYPMCEDDINIIYDSIQKRVSDNGIGHGCGTTAIVVARYRRRNGEKYVQVINLGDCRAVVSENGYAIPLSKDHKPDWPDENKRITAINGKIEHFDGAWRVNGDLSVSRVLGDIEHVPYVSNHPESHIYKISCDADFIIIACDGLWDVLQNHDAVNFVQRSLDDNTHGGYTGNDIANKLAQYAIDNGSTDNVSVIIIYLK